MKPKFTGENQTWAFIRDQISCGSMEGLQDGGGRNCIETEEFKPAMVTNFLMTDWLSCREFVQDNDWKS